MRVSLPTRFHGLARLLGEFRPYRGRVALVFFLGLVISAIQPVAVRITQLIIDGLQKGAAPGFLGTVPLILIGVFIVSGLAKYFHNVIRRTLSERVVLKLRDELFESYLRVPLSYLDKRRSGEMLAALQADLAQVSQGIDTICDLFKEPFTFLGLLAAAFYCDWRLTLCTLIMAPVIAILFSRTGAAVKRYTSRNLGNFSDLMSISQEAIAGARVVKVFRLEDALLKKFHDVQDRYFRTTVKSFRVQELATPTVELIGAILIAAVIAYGSYRVSHGTLTTGNLVAFAIALGLTQMPLKQMNNAFLKLKGAEAAAERVYDTLDTARREEPKSGVRRLGGLTDGIRYEGVGLCYGDRRALSGVTFTVRRGECVAFVGGSGSGKSSLANLLPRLYEPDEGSITIDGVDIRDFDLDELRGGLSFVTQDTFLFHDTIYENIRYGRPTATRAEVERAAELAHCTDFIADAPRGFSTILGDRGVCLSGGERQRIAIARAVLKGAPILVLDEATSSLDSHSEGVVQSALDELMAGKTTLMVAHRFATLRRAHRIFVMDSGKLHESGTHEELVGRRGIYHALYEKQALISPLS